MRPWLLFVILCAGWSERSFAYESLLETRSEFHTSHVVGRLGKEMESLGFKGDSTLTYHLKHNAEKALTISTWIWLSSAESSFFAVNDMFFHGIIFGLERAKDLAKGKRLMFCVGTGDDWEKVGCNVECIAGSWNHLVATIDAGGNVTEYLNGRPVVYLSIGKKLSMIPETPLRVMFGRESPHDNSQELGRLEEFDVYDHALTPGEVLSLFQSKKTPAYECQSNLLTLFAVFGCLFAGLYLITRFIQKIYLQVPGTVRNTGNHPQIRRESLY